MTDNHEYNSGGKSLLLVHGRDFKPARAPLMDISSAALRAGIKRDYPDCVSEFDDLNKDIAYYGDLSNDFLDGLGVRYDERLDIGDRRSALNELCDIDARKRFGLRQYDSLPGKSAVPEFVADVAAPILGAVGLTIPLVSSVSKDFAAYLRGESDFASKVRDRVRAKLCDLLDRGDRVLLVSHGTGCAVTYEILWQLSHDETLKDKYSQAKIDMWITLGSPLGDNGIRKRLMGATKKTVARFPTNVIAWHNVSAEDDYVCYDKTLADDFKQMMQERVVSAVRDYRIYNLAIRYGRSNPHSSVGYLIHPRVSKLIESWLKSTVADTSP